MHGPYIGLVEQECHEMEPKPYIKNMFLNSFDRWLCDEWKVGLEK